MFRPEYCGLDQPQPSTNQVSCELVKTVSFGSYVDHILASSQQRIVVRGVECGQSLSEGSAVTLDLDRNHAWLFPAN